MGWLAPLLQVYEVPMSTVLGRISYCCNQCKGGSSIPGSEDSEDDVPLASVQVQLQAEKRRAGTLNFANRNRERAAAMDRNGGDQEFSPT